MSLLKPLALAAVTAAFAVAIPASANAATTDPVVDPTVCSLLNNTMGPFGPTHGIGGASLSDVLAKAGASVGCAAPAAPAAPMFPHFPFPMLP